MVGSQRSRCRVRIGEQSDTRGARVPHGKRASGRVWAMPVRRFLVVLCATLLALAARQAVADCAVQWHESNLFLERVDIVVHDQGPAPIVTRPLVEVNLGETAWVQTLEDGATWVTMIPDTAAIQAVAE